MTDKTDDNDPFMEKGRDVNTGRVERLGDVVRQTKGQQALDKLRDDFEQSTGQLQKKHEETVERITEDAYKQGVQDTLAQAMKFQNEYGQITNELLDQCRDPDTGEIIVEELNKRLPAIKEGSQLFERILDRNIGKAKVRTEQSGQIDVIHKMQQITDALEEEDDFDYDL